jgi:hypothetical protein
MKLQIKKNYIIYATLLFITEALIAYYLKTGFIRHTFGDYLVVILIYCFFKIFIRGYSNTIAIGVLVFAFIIEYAQYFDLIEILNPNNNQIIKLILGNTFQISDLIAYAMGIVTILIINRYRYKKA